MASEIAGLPLDGQVKLPIEQADALVLSGISKSYPGVRALTDIDFSCRSGEVHAVVGENGSGKSTLVKVASGVVRADQGTVSINGQTLVRPSPKACKALGLLTAYQDTSLINEISVADSVVMSYCGRPQLPRIAGRLKVAPILNKYDLEFRPSDRVGDLSPAARQLLEIVRALVHKPTVLLLDEPTAAMDAGQLERLMQILVDARADGCGILYISHRLDEVERIADRLTVLRDGVVQGTYEGRGWSAAEILNLMVGVRMEAQFPNLPTVENAAAPVLQLKNMVASGVGPISLSVNAGEIVGIAGAEGNGQRELLRTIGGLTSRLGDIRISGSVMKLRTPRQARAAGISLISGDRAVESSFALLSVMQNLTVSARGDLGPAGTVLRSKEQTVFASIAKRLRIVHASPDQPMPELSGGNQQKVVLGRSLVFNSRVILYDEPTMGVDARARLDIYRAISEQAANGAAVVVSSSDSAELAGICNRVYVMSRGQIVNELQGGNLHEAQIVEAFVRPEELGGHAHRADGSRDGATQPNGETLSSKWWSPWFVAAMVAAFGIYTAVDSSTFLTSSNLNNLFLTFLPFSVAALGAQFCLITGGFDISIGSTMTVAVVVASFVCGTASSIGAVPGVLLVLAIGLAIGVINGLLVRKIGIETLIATIATLGILQGVAILLRPQPAGLIGSGLTKALEAHMGFLPVAVVVVTIVALVMDLWLQRSTAGLFVRAAGRSEVMSYRNGLSVNLIRYSGFIVSGVLAAVGGLFLAVQVGVGDNTAGSSYALPAYAACFIGGAALTGGRGSFLGCTLGSLLLALMTNATPLLDLPSSTTQIVTGAVTIAAIVGYSLRRGALTSVVERWLRVFMRGAGSAASTSGAGS